MTIGISPSPARRGRLYRTTVVRAAVSFGGAALLALLAASCTAMDRVPIIIGNDVMDASAPPSFEEVTDSGVLGPDEAVSYCPSDRCPRGRTTCPSSRFLCDTDLLTDPDNCGSCGNACRVSALEVQEEYSCVDGRCVLACQAHLALDCDGLADNGCEASPRSNDSCGACGIVCPADKPCINRGLVNPDIGCGCRPGELYCPNPANPLSFPCADPENDDANCGACGNACPPQGDGSETAPANTYFGCGGGRCGTLKCSGWNGDCDGVRENGCETRLLHKDHCGACGAACPDGQECGLSALGIPTCMCPVGQTFCGTASGGIKVGTCVDLTGDDQNCGACGARCGFLGNEKATEACVFGKCQRTCYGGWGDCNGNRDDGCETHIAADPQNCGACGNVCDAIAGQACVDGQCMVEPCDVIQDAGGPTR